MPIKFVGNDPPPNSPEGMVRQILKTAGKLAFAYRGKRDGERDLKKAQEESEQERAIGAIRLFEETIELELGVLDSLWEEYKTRFRKEPTA